MLMHNFTKSLPADEQAARELLDQTAPFDNAGRRAHTATVRSPDAALTPARHSSQNIAQ